MSIHVVSLSLLAAPLRLLCGTTGHQTPWTRRILPNLHPRYFSALLMLTVPRGAPRGAGEGAQGTAVEPTAQTCPRCCYWETAAWSTACWKPWRDSGIWILGEMQGLLPYCRRREEQVRWESWAHDPPLWAGSPARAAAAASVSLCRRPWPQIRSEDLVGPRHPEQVLLSLIWSQFGITFDLFSSDLCLLNPNYIKTLLMFSKNIMPCTCR